MSRAGFARPASAGHSFQSRPRITVFIARKLTAPYEATLEHCAKLRINLSNIAQFDIGCWVALLGDSGSALGPASRPRTAEQGDS